MPAGQIQRTDRRIRMTLESLDDQIADIERQVKIGIAAGAAFAAATAASCAANSLAGLAHERADIELIGPVEAAARAAAVARDAADHLRIAGHIDDPRPSAPAQIPLLARLGSAALELRAAAENVGGAMPADLPLEPPSPYWADAARLRSAALELAVSLAQANAAAPPPDA